MFSSTIIIFILVLLQVNPTDIVWLFLCDRFVFCKNFRKIDHTTNRHCIKLKITISYQYNEAIF